MPTEVFNTKRAINVGGKRIELSYHGNTHQEGNIFIYVPKSKILMVVDIIFPGWVPFRRLALSNDLAGWVRGHDVILDFDFDVLIGGHLTRLGDKADVELQIEYVQDIRDSFDTVLGDITVLLGDDFMCGGGACGAIDAVHGVGTSFQTVAKWALFSAFFDASTMRCADILDAKYRSDLGPDDSKHLGGAETFNFSNCEVWFAELRIGNVD